MIPEQEQQLTQTLARINEQFAPSLPSAADAAQDSFSICGACGTYRTYKPDVNLALPLIGLIPSVGPQIVVLIKSLEAVADLACTTCPEAPASGSSN